MFILEVFGDERDFRCLQRKNNVWHFSGKSLALYLYEVNFLLCVFLQLPISNSVFFKTSVS